MAGVFIPASVSPFGLFIAQRKGSGEILENSIQELDVILAYLVYDA